MSAEVVSRLNPAAWRRQDLRHAAHLWNLNLLRAIGLTPTQRNLAFIIGQDTLARGFNFCIYDSLETLICELMADCREVFGAGEMNRSHCHRRWLERAQSEPRRLQRVLADVRESKRSRGVKNAGAYGEDLWKRWHEPAAKKSKESLKPSMITR